MEKKYEIHYSLKEIVPVFLNSNEKWTKHVKNMTHFKKWKKFLKKIKNMKSISPENKKKIITWLYQDVFEHHSKSTVRFYRELAFRKLNLNEIKYKVPLDIEDVLPPFLKSDMKWNRMVHNTDTLPKWKRLLKKITEAVEQEESIIEAVLYDLKLFHGSGTVKPFYRYYYEHGCKENTPDISQNFTDEISTPSLEETCPPDSCSMI